MAGYRTALGRVRGKGSAKRGVGDFIGERASGAALVLLVLWALRSAFVLAGGGYDGARAWLASPLNAALAVLLALLSFFHMRIGLRVIIEDYIERPASRIALLALNAAVCALGAVIAVVSTLAVAFGQGGA